MLQPREGNTQEGTSPNLARYSSARNPKNNALTHSLNPLCSQWSIRCQQSSSIQAGLGQATEVHSRSSLLPPSLLQYYCPSPGTQRSASATLPRWSPRQCCIWMAVPLLISTWPSHFQRLFFTSWAMSSMPARFQTSLLVTFCSHQMRRILLRHLPSKPLILLSNLLFVTHHCSKPQSSLQTGKGRMLETKARCMCWL